MGILLFWRIYFRGKIWGYSWEQSSHAYKRRLVDLITRKNKFFCVIHYTLILFKMFGISPDRARTAAIAISPEKRHSYFRLFSRNWGGSVFDNFPRKVLTCNQSSIFLDTLQLYDLRKGSLIHFRRSKAEEKSWWKLISYFWELNVRLTLIQSVCRNT